MPADHAAGRLVALDAFRGFAIAAMVLVNNLGDWGHLYGPKRAPPPIGSQFDSAIGHNPTLRTAAQFHRQHSLDRC